jgi:hypothetical protein
MVGKPAPRKQQSVWRSVALSLGLSLLGLVCLDAHAQLAAPSALQQAYVTPDRGLKHRAINATQAGRRTLIAFIAHKML